MNAKLKLSAIALLVMAGASSVVMAADSAELKVTGRIGAPTCNVSVGGTIDYGQIAVSALNADANADTVLPVKVMPGGVTVTCDANTNISVAFKDNRFSSAGGNTAAMSGGNAGGLGVSIPAGKGSGLGTDSAGNKVGGYNAVLSNAKLDGVAYGTGAIKGNGLQIGPYSSEVTADDGDSEFGFRLPLSPSVVPSAKVFTFDYSVLAQIAPRNKLDLTKPIDLDGSMALQVNYL